MKKLLFILLFCAACAKDAEREVQTTNGNFKVELLFEIDGCRVYRFLDDGRFRYFSNCKGSLSWSEHIGKATVDQEISTN